MTTTYRVMMAPNKYTPGHEVSRKATLASARRSAAAHKGLRPDSTIWIDYVHPKGSLRDHGAEDYERVETTHDGGR